MAASRYLQDEAVLLEHELQERHAELTRLVVHGSYGRTAVLLTGPEVTGVVDLDRSTHDLLAMDVAYALKSFCRSSA